MSEPGMRGTTLVFDLDGTLIDTAPDLIGSVNHMLAGLRLAAVDAHLIRPEISFGARRMLEKALAIRDVRLGEAELDRLYADYLVHYERHIARESRPFPGLLAALDRLQQRGARLAVCTNKWEGLARSLLGQLGLLDRFAAITGRDTFAVYKPDPAHLLGTIALAGGEAGHAVMIGDSDTDIRTAKAAGVPVVAVSFGYTDISVRELGADRVIDDFAELDAALAGLRD